MTIELDWNNPQALAALCESHADEVTPLVLERLLEHLRFEHVGDLPVAGEGRCAMWAPRDREIHRALAPLQVTIYHTPTVSRTRLRVVLSAIRSAQAVYKGCGIRVPSVTL